MACEALRPETRSSSSTWRSRTLWISARWRLELLLAAVERRALPLERRLLGEQALLEAHHLPPAFLEIRLDAAAARSAQPRRRLRGAGAARPGQRGRPAGEQRRGAHEPRGQTQRHHHRCDHDFHCRFLSPWAGRGRPGLTSFWERQTRLEAPSEEDVHEGGLAAAASDGG